MSYRLLITSIGSVTGQGVLKGLAKQKEFKYLTIGTDVTEHNAGRFMVDEFHKVPLATDKDYISSLIALCKKYSIDVLIPIHDNELVEVARHTEAFLNIGCLPFVSSSLTIDLCNDKLKTYNFFKEIDIPTPYTSIALAPFIQGLTFPVFLKPRKGIAAIGTSKINNWHEYTSHTNKYDNCLVQTYLSGQEFSIDCFCDSMCNPIEIIPRTRDVTRHGASVKGVTVKDWNIINYAKRILDKLPIVGCCNIQCFKVGGAYFFFEINPRFSATHIHSIEAGMNSSHMILQLLRYGKLDPRIGSFTEGLRMYRRWTEEFSL